MSVFAGCMDVRNMTTISEIDCPGCGVKDGIEVFTKDGLSVGESFCGCGFCIAYESPLEINSFARI